MTCKSLAKGLKLAKNLQKTCKKADQNKLLWQQ